MPNQSNSTTKNQNLPSEDKRYFPRWEVHNRVIYQLVDEENFREGITKDLSCAGMCLLIATTDSDGIQSEQKINLKVYLSKETIAHLSGHILWVKPFDEQRSEVGISFYNTPPKIQDIILNHAFRIDKEEFVKNFFKGWK